MAESLFEKHDFTAGYPESGKDPRLKKERKKRKKMKAKAKKLRKELSHVKQQRREEKALHDEVVRRIEAESKLQALELVLKVCGKSTVPFALQGEIIDGQQ